MSIFPWRCPIGCPDKKDEFGFDSRKTEYGWVVENGKQGDELRYRTMRDGLPAWTADHMEALRFCRRIDAERFAEEDEEAGRIAEHAWG